jgi:hypothetical protein
MGQVHGRSLIDAAGEGKHDRLAGDILTSPTGAIAFLSVLSVLSLMAAEYPAPPTFTVNELFRT